jgi:hypothetical protein
MHQPCLFLNPNFEFSQAQPLIQIEFQVHFIKKNNNDIATFCKKNGINSIMTSKYLYMLCQGRQQCLGYLLE